jgi:hypothetical protein
LRLITARRAIRLATGAAALAFLLSALAATASAATPPALTSAFSQSTIGVGATTTLAFTIADANASGTETGIGFTDTLPSGLTVAQPNGESGSCGSSATTPVVANPGSNAISLTGGTLTGGAPGASGTTCVVSVNVTSNTPGNYSNTAGAVSSSDGVGTSDTQALTVGGSPTVTVTSPADNSTFTYGQMVIVTFSCAEGTFGPGLVDCSATDNNGNTINSGGTLDTTIAGKGQQIQVTATSGDSLVVQENVDYTVLPDNQYTVSGVTAKKGGVVTVKLKLPGAGKVAVSERVDGVAFSSVSVSAHGAKTLTVTLKPSKAGRKLLAKLARQKHPPKLTAKLSVAYTPTGGRQKTTTVGGVKLRR